MQEQEPTIHWEKAAETHATIRRCRDCRYWRPIPPWQGNCGLHPSKKPQWSQSATAGRCLAYSPKLPQIN